MSSTLYPIYSGRGDLAAFLAFPFVYNQGGEWIGWVSSERKVYSVHGQYVGSLEKGPRILRKLSDGFDQPRQRPPLKPPKINVPSMAPLAPLMAELSNGVIDVLESAPELLPTLDAGEREDLD